jgi:prevent-host-death family protein
MENTDYTENPMTTTNASDFQKRLGEFADLARREPVMITRHGRPSLVLLAAEDYERLRLIEARSTKAIKTADLPDETVEAMMGADHSHLPAD